MTDEIYGTYSHASPISLQIHWTDSAERFFEATFGKVATSCHRNHKKQLYIIFKAAHTHQYFNINNWPFNSSDKPTHTQSSRDPPHLSLHEAVKHSLFAAGSASLKWPIKSVNTDILIYQTITCLLTTNVVKILRRNIDSGPVHTYIDIFRNNRKFHPTDSFQLRAENNYKYSNKHASQ